MGTILEGDWSFFEKLSLPGCDRLQGKRKVYTDELKTASTPHVVTSINKNRFAKCFGKKVHLGE